MTHKTFTSLLVGLGCIALLSTTCRPPMKWVDHKSAYFQSTKPKNRANTIGKINTTGAFVCIDTMINRPTFSIIKFNSNQTVQVSEHQLGATQPLTLDSITYLNYLDNKVSYYYYVDRAAQTLILERFEYWSAPWWNVFVNTNHYIMERFSIQGDTLINHVNNRFSRFGRQYLLDKRLTTNFDRLENEFIRE